MELLKFSVGGVRYGSGITEIEQARYKLDNPTAQPLVDSSLDKPILAHEDRNFRFYDPKISNYAWLKDPNGNTEIIADFLLALALCHEVCPQPQPLTLNPKP